MLSEDYDFAIVGSGFGGSISALRLAEKGYRVVVLEQGKRVTPEDMLEAAESMRALFWMPKLKWEGFLTQNSVQRFTLMRGIGVGGGSLVYAGVLLEPAGILYNHLNQTFPGMNWEEELAPHFATAKKMVGAVPNPTVSGPLEDMFRKTAEALGAESTLRPVDTGIYFGEPPGETVADPFFGGIGPARAGCQFCGNCQGGCPYNAKNSMDKNYLYLAERLGAVVLSRRRVYNIVPQDKGFVLESCNPMKPRQVYRQVRAKQVVLSAGVAGTLELLFHCRNVSRTLPGISPRLGRSVRTNAETVTAALVLGDDPPDLSEGTAVSAYFKLGEGAEKMMVQACRMADSYKVTQYTIGPLVDDNRPGRRALRTLFGLLRHLSTWLKLWRTPGLWKQGCAIGAALDVDNEITLKYHRSLTGRKHSLKVDKGLSDRAPALNMPLANKVTETFARVNTGADYQRILPCNLTTESLFRLPMTAHIMGGCCIADSPEKGVVGLDHQVFGVPGLYVADASVIPSNLCANPTLTIMAMTERAMSLMPARQ